MLRTHSYGPPSLSDTVRAIKARANECREALSAIRDLKSALAAYMALRRLPGPGFRYVNRRPLGAALLGWIVTALALIEAHVVEILPPLSDSTFRLRDAVLQARFSSAALNLIYMYALLSLLNTFVSAWRVYPSARRFASGLMALYVSVLLAFANLYFAMTLTYRSAPFDGIHRPSGADMPLFNLSRVTSRDAALTALDSLHFSCATIATVGYGDIRPVSWLAKLLVDAEILAGLTIITIGIGRRLSKERETRNV